MWDLLPPFLQEMPESVLQDALAFFDVVQVEAGIRLMEEGEDDPSLVIVLNGELVVSTGGTFLGRAHGGDVLGEIALFGHGMRTATVDARVATRMLLLDADGYRKLRDAGSPMAAMLEDYALTQLTRRLEVTSARIAELSEGRGLAFTPPGPGFFDRVASMFGAGGTLFPAQVEGAETLARSRLFAGVPRPVLEEVAAHFHPVAVRRGAFLCTQGETGNDMFVIGEGLVEVIASVGGERVQHLATLEVGDAFGMGALVMPEQHRRASCVAAERVVALSMDRIAWAEVISGANPVGSAMRVAMIRALADQLAHANGKLSMLDPRHARVERADASSTSALLHGAAAALESHGAASWAEPASLPFYLQEA